MNSKVIGSCYIKDRDPQRIFGEFLTLFERFQVTILQP